MSSQRPQREHHPAETGAAPLRTVLLDDSLKPKQVDPANRKQSTATCQAVLPLNNARSRARISFVPPFHYCRQTLRHLSKQREYAAQISCLNAPRSDTILQATVQRIAGPSRLSTTAARPYLSKQREYAATKACLNAPRIDTILQKPVRRIAGPSCLSTTAARPYLSKQREHAAQPACLNAPRIITLQAYTQIWVDVGVANSQALGFTGAPEVY